MRKKLAGIHLLAPLSETDIVDYSRNLDRELIVNSTIVTDAIVDTVEKTNYIVTFEYDTTLDGGTHQIRRSIPTLELLSYTGENMSGAHWVNVEDMDYHYITPGTSSQQAFEELDEEISKLARLKHLKDADGNGAIVSSADGEAPSSTVDSSIYAIVLGSGHTLSTSPNSGIIGGTNSTITGISNAKRLFIIGGDTNTISGVDNEYYNDVIIISGWENLISDSTNSTIINGFQHHIQTYSHESVIIGGHNNILRNLAFNSSIISTNNSIIESSMFSSMESTASSYINNSDFSASIASAYIHIYDGLHNKITNSKYGVILDTDYSTIDGNNVSDSKFDLTIYNAISSMVSHSLDSYIWNATGASIISSNASHIYDNKSTISTSKSSTYIVVESVTGFTVGQLVTLTGAEFTGCGYKIYIISSIDIDNKRLSFINTDGTSLTFNTGSSDIITIRTLNESKNESVIISNTSDTLVLSNTIPLYTAENAYAFISDGVNRYTVIAASGTPTYTNTIKLKLFGSNDIITTFTANQFSTKKIIVYTDANIYTSYSNICASVNSYIANVGNVSINASTKAYITYAGNSMIHSSSNVHIYSASTSAIIASSNNYYISYIESASYTLLMGSEDSYIKSGSNCSIISSTHSYIGSGNNDSIISSIQSSIYNVSNSLILGGVNNTISDGYRGIVLGGIKNTINVDSYDTVVIGCNNVTATRGSALYTPSLTLVNNTIELTNKIPTVGDTLVVESITGNVATLKWGKSIGGNDMTPIDINHDPTSIADYNTDPSKIVYYFNCETCNTNTGNYRKTFNINTDNMYPIGTIIYIILYRVASATSEPDSVAGFSVNCGSHTYKFSTNSGSAETSCRTIAFQKVKANEWIIVSSN